MQQMRVANQSGGGGLADTAGRTSETAVTIPPTITYGLQETHTTVLPAICWFSAPNLLLDYKPKTFAFRLNSIYDLMTVGTIQTDVQDGNKFWTKKCGETNYAGGAATGYAFPSENWTYASGFYPWYRDYWEKLYMYYTVLGCEYEIVISNPGIAGRKALVAHSIQTVGSNNSTSVSLGIDVPLKELYGMKNIHFDEIHGRDNGVGKNNVSIISGTYKPGTALRDVSNDGDVKLWHKTNTTGTGETPVYTERLQVMSYLHPMSTAGVEADGVTGSTTSPDFLRSDVHLNFQVRLKYIVQFKQLRQEVRFPISGTTAGPNIQFPAVATPYVGS